MNRYMHSECDEKVVDGQPLRVDKMLTSLVRSLQRKDKDNQSEKNALAPSALRFMVRAKRCALHRVGI